MRFHYIDVKIWAEINFFHLIELSRYDFCIDIVDIPFLKTRSDLLFYLVHNFSLIIGND